METLTTTSEHSISAPEGEWTFCDLCSVGVKAVGTVWLTAVTWGASDALTATFVAAGYSAALLGGAILPRVRNPRECDS